MEHVEAGTVKEIERISREAEREKLRDTNEIREIHGEKYVRNKAGELVKFEAADYQPGCLEFNTLQSLVDYVKDNPDKAFGEGAKRFARIVDPETVEVGFGARLPYMRRCVIAKADAVLPAFEFGKRVAIERFLVDIRSLFVRTTAIDQVVDWLSNIDSTNAVRATDDGLSQVVTVNRGARGKEGIRIPNPIPLQPHRTFAEVPQPESPFLLRMYAGGLGELPTVSLTDADLGGWRLVAIRSIKEWLTTELKGSDVSVYG